MHACRPTLNSVFRAKEIMEKITKLPARKIVAAQLIVPVSGFGSGKGLIEPLNERIISVKEVCKLDKKKAAFAIESGFGKNLVSGFFSKGGIMEVFHTPDFTAIAVIKDVLDIPYIDKLAIAPGAQGKGLGTEMMNAIISAYPKCMLRASPGNEAANALYSKFFAWSEPANGWNVFARNLSMHEMGPAIAAVSQIPKTLF